MSERLPENTRRPGARNKPTRKPSAHRVTGAELIKSRRSKKSTSALGKLDRSGRAVPAGPLGVAGAFTAGAGLTGGKRGAPTSPARLSKADRKAVKKATAAKRPTRAQKDLLAAASVRKAAANAKRSSTLKATNASRKKLAASAAAGKVQTGRSTPRGPLG